ncbi:MAG: hypothetical protein ACK5EW_02825 [Bacteroidota bacterium]|jgi:uncharacterized protein YukE
MRTIVYSIYAACILFPSCTFYYTTAEIDQNIKTTVQSAESATSKSTEQINNAFKTYNEIPCEKNTNPYVIAESIKADVTSKMESINHHASSMRALYSDFKSYTAGKDKITSKSQEWEKVKITKEALELETKALEKEFKELSDASNTFTSHVQNEIINKTELCIVANVMTEMDASISNLRKSATTYRSSAQEYDKEIQNLIAKFSGKFPKEIEKLNASITEVRALSNEINLIIASVDKSAYKFKTACKGIDKIYSCDPKWTTINQLKQETTEASKRLSDIEKKTNQIIENNQALVLSLK